MFCYRMCIAGYALLRVIHCIQSEIIFYENPNLYPPIFLQATPLPFECWYGVGMVIRQSNHIACIPGHVGE
jgi:hypothetical protein